MKSNGEPTKAIEDIDWGAIADGIDALSNATTKALDCGLTEDTIVLLLWDKTKVGKGQIRKVLRALPRLQEFYLKPE